MNIAPMPKTSPDVLSDGVDVAGLAEDAVASAGVDEGVDAGVSADFGDEVGLAVAVFCGAEDAEAAVAVFADDAAFFGTAALAGVALTAVGLAAADLAFCVTMLTFSALGDVFGAVDFVTAVFCAAARRVAPDFAPAFADDVSVVWFFDRAGTALAELFAPF